MSLKVEEVLEQLNHFSIEELLSVQERVTQQLRQKLPSSNKNWQVQINTQEKNTDEIIRSTLKSVMDSAELALKKLSPSSIEQLRRKTTSNGISNPDLKNTNSIEAIILPTPTQEEIKAELKEFLGDDYDEVMAQVTANEGKLITLPPMPKTVSEYINEDREDRV